MSLFLNLLFETDSYSNEYLLAQIGVDTAENEPLKAQLIFQPWDLIFTEPPRPLCHAAWLASLPRSSSHCHIAEGCAKLKTAGVA